MQLESWVLSVARERLRDDYDGSLEVDGFVINVWRLEATVERLRLTARTDVADVDLELDAGRIRLRPGVLADPSRASEFIAQLHLERPRIRVDLATREGEDPAPVTDGAPVRLQIDDLRIVDGAFEVDDRSGAGSVSVSSLDVTGARRGDGAGWIGELAAGVRAVGSPIGRPLPVSFRTAYRYGPDGLRLRRTRIQGPGLDVRGDGHVEWQGTAVARFDGEAEVDLARVEPFLDASMPTLAGRGTLGVHLLVDGSGWLLDGPLDVTDVAVDDLVAERAEARMVLDRDGIAFEELRADAFGGTLRGRVAIGLVGPTAIDLAARGESVDARELLDWLELPLPLDTILTPSIRLRGRLDDRRTWEGSATFAGSPLPGGPGLPTSVEEGRLTFDGGVVRIDARRVDLAGARVAADGAFDIAAPVTSGRLTLDGTTGDADTTRRGVLAMLRALEVAAPDELRREVDGRGTVRAEIPVNEPGPIRVDLDLSDGRWGDQRFDRLRTTLMADDASFRLDETLLEVDASTLAGALTVDTVRGIPTEIDLEATDFRPGTLLSQVGLIDGLGGTWTGRIAARSDEGAGLNGSGRLDVVDFELGGETVERVAADVAFREGTVALEGLVADAFGGRIEGRADWNLTSGTGAAEIERASVDLATLVGDPAPVRGRVVLAGRVDWRDGGPAGTLDLRAEEIGGDGFVVGAVGGRLVLDGARLDFELDDAGRGLLRATGTLGLVEDLPLSAAIRVEGLPIDGVLTSPDAPRGQVTADVAVAIAAARPETLELQATVHDAVAWVGVHEVRLAAPFDASYGPTGWQANDIRIGTGDAQLLGSVRSGEAESGGFVAEAVGRVDLAVLSAVAPELRAIGTADVRLGAVYAESGLDLDGSVSFSGARLRILGFPETIAAIDGRLRFRNGELTVDGVTGRVGGGELRITGTGDVGDPARPTLALDLSAVNVRLAMPEGFRGIYEAEIGLNVAEAGASLAGRVEIVRGLYDDAFEIGGGGRAVTGSAIDGLPTDLELDIDIVSPAGVWVRNDLIEAEALLDLEVGGTAGRPEVAGRIVLRDGGEIHFRDVDYRILDASLDFVDPRRLDPYITLRAVTQIAEYEVQLRVEGTSTQFEYELTSTPSLAQQDIISLLATGRTLQDLTGRAGRTEFTGDLAANYFAGALTDRFERQLERVLRLERFQIDPLLAQEDADPTARITVGKAVADDVFVIFSTDLNSTEDQRYEVEWRLSRKTRASASRSTEGGVGGDIQYYDRYWWKKPDPAAVPADRPSETREIVPGDGGTVASVRITGLDGEPRERARRRVGVEPGAAYSRSAMFAGLEALRRMLVGQGYLEAEVEAVATPTGDGTAYDVEYWVQRGRRLDVVIEGVPRKRERERLDRLLRDRWSFAVFTEDLYDDAVDVLLADLHDRGYYAADVQQFERKTPDGTDVVVFSVDRGPVVRVRDLALVGVESVEIDAVKGQLLTRESSLLQRGLLIPEVLAADVRAVRSLYRSRGYLDVVVAEPRIRLSADGQEASVTIEIEEGAQTRIAGVEIVESGPLAAEDVARWSGLESGQVYSPDRLLGAESSIRAALDDRGYPSTRVRATATRVDGGMAVEVRVEPGERRRLAEVTIVGLDLTRESVVRRALQVSPGDLLSREAILRSQHELYRTGIFRNVRLTTEPIEDAVEVDGAVPHRLIVRVEEAKPLATSIGVGYDTEGGERFNFSATHQNVGGRNRILSVQGYASDILTRVQFVGEAPHLFGRADPTLLNVAVEDRDEIGFKVRRRSAAVRFDRRYAEKWRGFLRYSFQRVDLREISNVLAVQEEKLENLRLGDVGYTIVRDSRDDPLLTRRGTYGSLSTRVFLEGLGGDVSFVKSQFTTSWTHTYPNRTALASGLRLGLAEPFGSTSRVPLSERFFAGGDSTLRGFGRDEVGPLANGLPSGGEALFLLNQEFRFPVAGALRGTLFYDAGNVYEDLSDFDPTDLRHVLGVGLRYETAIGPLRLEYGRKLDRRTGESDAELFIAIGAAF